MDASEAANATCTCFGPACKKNFHSALPSCHAIIACEMLVLQQTSGDPESNQGPSDCCRHLQSDALPTELSPACSARQTLSTPRRSYLTTVVLLSSAVLALHESLSNRPSVSARTSLCVCLLCACLSVCACVCVLVSLWASASCQKASTKYAFGMPQKTPASSHTVLRLPQHTTNETILAVRLSFAHGRCRAAFARTACFSHGLEASKRATGELDTQRSHSSVG